MPNIPSNREQGMCVWGMANRFIPMKPLLTIALLSIQFAVFSQSQDAKYKSFEEEVKKIVKQTDAIGVSVALIENYRIVWAKGFGITRAGTTDSVTGETLFQTASVTKAITAAVAMRDIQEGKFSFNENVNKWLSSWRVPENNYTKESPVTVQKCLSHTTGISHPGFMTVEPNEVPPTLVQALRGEAPAKNEPVTVNSQPGKYKYIGAGDVILELLLTEIEKKEYSTVVQEKLLAPLQMNHSTFERFLPNEKFKSVAFNHIEGKVIKNNYQYVYPLSFWGMWSTPTDLANFIIDLQLSLNGKSGKTLTERNAKTMVAPEQLKGLNAYTNGFMLEKRGTGIVFFGHDGHNPGSISTMIASIDGHYGLVILTNSEDGWKAINKIKKLAGRTFWGF
jgi:CubicO group peptidase (beta-lactamase class C family)